MFVGFGPSLPKVDEIEDFEPPLATTLYDRNGEVLYQFYEERRTPVPLDKVPQHVQNAFVSLEDKRFWEHWGWDPVRIVKAMIVNVATLSIRQGSSTITMQLARNMFLTPEQTWKRKLGEAVLAVRIERALSKEEILERYLNQIYFGNGVYGIGAASRYYFGKSVGELTVAEAALLAGLPKNPYGYSPYKFPDRAYNRQKLVLAVMKRNGAITGEQYEEAKAEELALNEYRREYFGGAAPYFVEYIRTRLIRDYGEEFVYRGGGKIYTTLDLDMQTIANRVVDSLLDYYEEVKWKEHLSPKRSEFQYDPKSTAKPRYLQASLLAMGPATGEVLAYVGGRNFLESMYDRVSQAKRQVGSAFKPFVYASAVQFGYSPGDIVPDVPIEIQDGARVWSPNNYDGKYEGLITIRRALQLSRNLPTVRLALEVGPGTIAEMARNMGITTPLPPVLSLALGSASLTLLEMTRAYATIANMGIRVEPLFIRKIVDAQGNVLEENFPVQEPAVDPTVAGVTLDLMTSVMDGGTGSRARWIYKFTRPAAGKTGTTNDYKDTWFIGFTPDLVAGVWVGYDQPQTIIHGATGTAFALPVWASFMREALASRPVTRFPSPPGLKWVRICRETGQLPVEGCRDVRKEAFLAGHEPTVDCELHGDNPKHYYEKLFQMVEVEHLKLSRDIPLGDTSAFIIVPDTSLAPDQGKDGKIPKEFKGLGPGGEKPKEKGVKVAPVSGKE